jgi:NADPH:quinone reductase-like Zn-dependent oxidoreductase
MGKGKNLGLRVFFLPATLFPRMSELATAYQTLFAAFQSGGIYLPISRMPLAEVQEAHRRIEAQETVGKVILQP